MKFGKEYVSHMVHEWEPAYMNYNYLKKLLNDILVFRNRRDSTTLEFTRKGSLHRKLSFYRSFSGLTSRFNNSPESPVSTHQEDEAIFVSEVELEEGPNKTPNYQTTFLGQSEEGGEYELMFFRRLDDEFNKVLKFYAERVLEMKNEARDLSKQMDALIALRIRVHNPSENVELSVHFENIAPDDDNSSPKSVIGSQGVPHMDVIEEVETTTEENSSTNGSSRGGTKSTDSSTRGGDRSRVKGFRPAPIEVLDRVKINIEPDTPLSTLKNVLNCSNNLSFSYEELRKAEERLKQAFVIFYHKLRVLKSYSLLNQTAFTKIMKKYDKITSRNASKAYLDMVEKSYLGSSDEVARLINRVEITYIKHFAKGNRSEGMKALRHQAKRERHRVSFSLGLFTGCSIALIVAIIVSMRARHLIDRTERDQYMENIFPLYSLFGYAVLHLVMYAGAIYYWRKYRVNYPFIFGFKQGTQLGYNQILLLASGLAVLALAASLANLDLEMDPRTKSYETVTELVPLALVLVVLLVSFCPFNIIYRSSRFFFLRCAWHCICAPFYKVNLPDFFLADQMTSQVQAIRGLLFYVCYYGWGDFKKRSHKCHESDLYQALYTIVAVIPFWARFLQCVRRFFEEKDTMQGLNSLKYFSTIIALVMRTGYDQRGGSVLRILAAVTSGLTTVVNTYWDVVIDWGLLTRHSKNRWLRNKLLVPNKAVYFVAIVVNILLRLVWMQLVLDFNQTSFLHRKAFVAVVACLEIIRRGIWNFFRLENEQLNNVGKYRAHKTVPLPFNYDKDDDESL